ncbi:uncharacterized protein LOC134740806 isoform X1 [Cydia strobilella]|uniref:uncharacterized protein LOC134740806 isoform X1 n=1 Tax=Cydia strobilella TaxID=1100964 RepID=UPI00300513C3
MSKFWDCEKVPDIIKETGTEAEQAEQIFLESVKLENDKFTVAMPVKVELDKLDLGDSFSCALQRFFNLEKRFSRDLELSKKYKKFIHDYIDQGHAKYFDMSTYDLSAGNVMFLPHHPVISSSKTTPVRAVFDAGAVTKKGICLNDILLNGPVVQKDLFEILILFRTFKYVLLCDIKAMYRQILIEDKYRCLQNILWRDSPDDSVKCVQLQTVTYGLKNSAFLACRCLLELAQRYESQYPLASFVLKHTCYVDDIQCGSNDLNELIQMKKELVDLMKLASLSLHKWCSNNQEILSDIPVEFHQLDSRSFDKNNEYVKTLGLTYDVITDTLNMQCPVKEVQEKYTKRQMLSFISKFFDPLGLCGPVLVQAKILMQQVWFESLKWDEFLPQGLNQKWVDFANSLVQMSCISIARNINVQGAQSLELVGFSDASNAAHGCCLYLRVIDADNKVSVNLLCSKSRINPKAKSLTIPKLELNGALLLAILARKVYTALSLKYSVSAHLYSDSMILLAWLKTLPVKLNMYVGNRVDKINKLSSGFEWHYVNTHDNAADILSRGVEPQLLEKCDIWWHGPKFLSDPTYHHKPVELDILKSDVPELRPTTETCYTCVDVSSSSIDALIQKCSNINKLTRIVGYLLRFVFNCKHLNINKRQGHLSPQELESALRIIIKCEQRKFFCNDIEDLNNKFSLKSSINSLHPFLDSEGLLRVGGRLQNAGLSYDQKHPIILPKGSHVTKIIVHNEHLRLKHAGATLLLSTLNEKYWILNANRELKSVLYKCIKCFRLKAKNASQLMGSLPFDRVNMTRPFQIVGTDYAGPFYVKQSRIRRPVITKAYVVIFVCFVTKAIHIELASDMTTDTFLGCLKRFIARRNKPTKIYCDNAAYYKGAENVLKELYDLQNSTNHQASVVDFSSSERIAFHFIPSYSPVFGGLWEAGIKSVKYHMKRVIANTVFTYEQMYSTLVQFEAILNSRPLTPMSRDPSDMTYLTPGHFLTGSPLTSYPETDITDVNVGRLSFWKQCVQLQQHFWKQWHKQYLVMLQSRPKWRNESPNLEIGNLVLLREDNTSPLCWPVGRIVDVQPGKDGKVRALHVKNAKGFIVKTSVTKVCPLPIDYS